jgi:UDP-glucose:(glucosyl) LPS alpha1,3-glucosyltransferase
MFSNIKLVNKRLDLVINHNHNHNHIVFSSDFKYSKYIGISILSILENNIHEKYNFHIFVNEIDILDLNRIRSLPYKNINIFFYWLDDSIVEGLQTTQHFSKGMYYRLLIPYILHRKVDTFLYLDTDVICVGSISEIFSTNLSKKVVAAVPDTIEEYHLYRLYELGFKKESIYFNSGVMYINTSEWVNNKITEKFLSLIGMSSYVYPDQDVLNLILNNSSVVFLSEKFNYQKWLKLSREDFYEECKLVSLVHFIGPHKPWSISGYNRIYNYYKSRSFWKKQEFENIDTTLGLKKASKYFWKDGNKFISVWYHVRYLIRKLKRLK